MDVPVWLWAVTLGAIVVMLLVDLFAHRDNHVVETREAAIWSAVWIVTVSYTHLTLPTTPYV